MLADVVFWWALVFSPYSDTAKMIGKFDTLEACEAARSSQYGKLVKQFGLTDYSKYPNAVAAPVYLRCDKRWKVVWKKPLCEGSTCKMIPTEDEP